MAFEHYMVVVDFEIVTHEQRTEAHRFALISHINNKIRLLLDEEQDFIHTPPRTLFNSIKKENT